MKTVMMSVAALLAAAMLTLGGCGEDKKPAPTTRPAPKAAPVKATPATTSAPSVTTMPVTTMRA